MKRHFTLIQFTLLAGILLSCNKAPTTVKENLLRLDLSLDKEIYHVGEPIKAKIVITNVGDKDILIKKRMLLNSPGSPVPLWDIIFVFSSSSTKKQPHWVARIYPASIKTDGFIILDSGKSIETQYDLIGLYYIEEGDYSVFALYQN